MKTFSSALQLLFIGLKLCGVVAWSWFWVLSPTLIPLALALILCAGYAAYLCFFETQQARAKRQASEAFARYVRSIK